MGEGGGTGGVPEAYMKFPEVLPWSTLEVKQVTNCEQLVGNLDLLESAEKETFS